MNNPFRSNPIILKNSDLIWVRFYFDLRRKTGKINRHFLFKILSDTDTADYIHLFHLFLSISHSGRQ